MLPYTPLHVLLFGLGDDRPGPTALVMTSGNLWRRADRHRRRARRCTGSPRWPTPGCATTARSTCRATTRCCRVVDGAELPIRRSRGYAPLPLALPFDVPADAGGRRRPEEHLRARGGPLRLGQPAHRRHGRPGHRRRLRPRPSGTWSSSPASRPTQLVADAHPGYRSAALGPRRTRAGRPVRLVQHHHAHIAAVMGEHGLDGRRPRDRGRLRRHRLRPRRRGLGRRGAGRRLQSASSAFAHLAYVPLAGGDASVLRPTGWRWRTCARPASTGTPRPAAPCAACPDRRAGVLAHQFETGFGCVPTSSMGRLFDAVASLAGVRHVVDYEARGGHRAGGAGPVGGPRRRCGRRLRVRASGSRPAEPRSSTRRRWSRAVVADVRAGVPVPVIAARFHAAVAGARRRASRELGRVRDRAGHRGPGRRRVPERAAARRAPQRLLAAAGFAVLRAAALPAERRRPRARPDPGGSRPLQAYTLERRER